MSLDLLDYSFPSGKPLTAGHLVRCLCIEVNVPPANEDDDYEPPPPISAATWDVDAGLVVTADDGRKWRLRVTAEELP